jgi:hypothetical protein
LRLGSDSDWNSGSLTLKLKNVVKPEVEPLFSFAPLGTGLRQVGAVKTQELLAQMSAGRASSHVDSNPSVQGGDRCVVDHRDQHFRIRTPVGFAPFL